MKQRREALVVGLGAMLASPWVMAQGTRSTRPKIGLLLSESPRLQASRIAALQAGLAERGLVTGRTISFETRSAEGNYERLAALAAELVRINVDVIVAFGIKALVAAHATTRTVPIVIPATSSDLVAAGLAISLARPGGNVTGSTTFGPEILTKRLELLKELKNTVTTVGVLSNLANRSLGQADVQMNQAAKVLKFFLMRHEVKSPGEFDAALDAMAKERVQALIIQDDTLFNEANSMRLAELSLRRGWISIGGIGFAEAGGTAGYGRSDVDLYRRGAIFIEKILNGQRPSDLPIEQATRFELVINMKSARALGIEVPHSIVLRADRAIH